MARKPRPPSDEESKTPSMDDNPLLSQYQIIREEIQKSIFAQYGIIKLGTMLMGAILVFIPAIYTAIGKDSNITDAAGAIIVSLLSLALVSMSLIFTMGAGEIRILRAAAFSNRILESLVLSSFPDLPRDLLWDNFVSKWNARLRGNWWGWIFEERVYLAMPFAIITLVADSSAYYLSYRVGQSEFWIICNVTLFMQAVMLIILVCLRRALQRANPERSGLNS